MQEVNPFHVVVNAEFFLLRVVSFNPWDLVMASLVKIGLQ